MSIVHIISKASGQQRLLVAKFLGIESYIWIFSCAVGGGAGLALQSPCCLRLNYIYFHLLMLCTFSDKSRMNFMKQRTLSFLGARKYKLGTFGSVSN